MAAHPTHTADQAKAAASPPDDKRWKVVEATMRRHGYAPHALIETLHTVQEGYGYLDEPELRRVSAALRVPLSRVYGVATFYHLFTLKPQGEHSCVVCTGTACYIKGIPAILQAIKDEFHISPGETTKDNKLSLLTARCLGACGLAPAGVFDGNVGGRLTPADAVARLHSIVESAAPEREAAHDA